MYNAQKCLDDHMIMCSHDYIFYPPAKYKFRNLIFGRGGIEKCPAKSIIAKYKILTVSISVGNSRFQVDQSYIYIYIYTLSTF